MPTEHVEYLLPDYINGRLEEALSEGVESHLRTCVRCTEQLELLRDAFASLEAYQPERPSASYYGTILPRVRQRLEQRGTPSFLSHPLFVRLISPLAVALVVIALVLHVQFPAGESEREANPLRSVVRGTSTAELAQAVLEQAHHQPLGNGLGESELTSLVAEQVLDQQLLAEGIDWQGTNSVEPLFNAASTQALEELSEPEIDDLLRRLGERSML